MKRLIGSIGDRLQAIFPPNRIMLVLAPTVTAASLWLSAWLTAHVPGVELPAGVIAGAMGVVGLIAVTLFYRWFDQWAKGEPLTVDEDLNHALDELEQTFGLLSIAHGGVQEIEAALEGLHARISAGSINEAEIAASIANLVDEVHRFVDAQSPPGPITGTPSPADEQPLAPPPGPPNPPEPPHDRPVA